MNFVLIGAGSAQFGLGMLSDIFTSETLAGSKITLVDINENALQKVLKIAKDYVENKHLPFSIEGTVERRNALAGADVVIISVEVGQRFKLWDEDWTLPQQYGIRQVYGENGGPGGIFHALRIVPVILEICDDIARLCPNAYVFNYSNPMTAIVTTVSRKYPDMKFIGMCHEIASLERYLPVILNTPFENLELRSAGLNHFSVLLEATYRDSGLDAYPDILQKAYEFFEQEPGYSDILAYVQAHGSVPQTEGSTGRLLLDSARSMKSWADRTLFKQILDHYRLLPITSDSHFGEYIQWAYDVADHKGIKDFYTLYQLSLSHGEAAIRTERHERIITIVEGIVNDLQYEEPAVNVMNHAYIGHVPSTVAVEVPAIVGKNGLSPIAFPDYPKGFGALLRNYSGVYDLVAEAVLTKNKQYVIQALLACPVVDTCRDIAELVQVMIERQKKYLGYLS
ncbi:MAG: alpha-glucosidase [Sphaerochaetaceae bacterium]|jgi:alpha-galactosidase|nr:alpha-glucosidase [Sphaerochaetaceae bacterium]MDX9810217.1 alpha-glucosidase [Sphaerochaetaceae bacterium]